ncbi:MAG: quinolinate synthase NadA [Oligoflexia bacterium]|nr:quinolinate synthase NadA [Oligoflexia bacterium]
MRKVEDLFEKIHRLKKERNAIILAHYYQDPDIQDIADYIGDSLGLSQQAKKANADVIVFAGVHFMAETAKILNPTKTVLLPDLEAGCSLADSCPADQFEKFVKSHPDHVVVSYINCTSEVKALSDYICTSSNAVSIVNSIPKEKKIIFAPDKNLGRYVMKETGREMLLWDGSCVVHETFSEKKLIQLMMDHPKAEVIAHPECEEIVLKKANYIGSTTALLNYAVKSKNNEFIVVTEAGILHQMKKAAPEKVFIPSPPNANCACNECPYMRRNTLEKIAISLETLEPKIEVSPKIQEKALIPIQRMLELS